MSASQALAGWRPLLAPLVTAAAHCERLYLNSHVRAPDQPICAPPATALLLSLPLLRWRALMQAPIAALCCACPHRQRPLLHFTRTDSYRSAHSLRRQYPGSTRYTIVPQIASSLSPAMHSPHILRCQSRCCSRSSHCCYHSSHSCCSRSCPCSHCCRPRCC
jgi:hypothetical protein